MTLPRPLLAAIVVLSLFSGTLLAQSLSPAAVIDVWPEGRVPGEVSTLPETAAPERNDGVLRLTHVSRPTLALFPAPGDAARPSPAAIVCPGGGYKHLAYEKEGTGIAAWLNAQGITALVLKYRVPDNREGALQDIQRALALARANASAWSIDPARLGVVGFSAGGHLAARASTRFSQKTYAALDDADTQSARPDFALLVYPAYLDRAGAVSPDLDLAASIPPTLLIHSEDDKKYVPGSRLYADALSAAKIDHRLILYPTGGHGYGLHSRGAARAWPEEARAWLQTLLFR